MRSHTSKRRLSDTRNSGVPPLQTLALLLLTLFLSGCAGLGVPGSDRWESSFLTSDRERDEDSEPMPYRRSWSAPSRENDFEDGPNRLSTPGRVRPGDVTVGMSLHEVRRSWGSPREVEFAGDSPSGNQRWIFPMGADPRVSPARVIYFEGGRVIGWETVHP